MPLSFSAGIRFALSASRPARSRVLSDGATPLPGPQKPQRGAGKDGRERRHGRGAVVRVVDVVVLEKPGLRVAADHDLGPVFPDLAYQPAASFYGGEEVAVI